MSRKNQIAEVRKAIAEGDRFLLVSHQNPDGDAIGSSLALAASLESLGKECEIVNVDGVPATLTWLPLAERVQLQPAHRTGYDVVVLLDCGSQSRTGLPDDLLKAGRVSVNIDHHPGNAGFATVNLVDPEACATAELVYDLLQAIPAPIRYSAATAIYTAVLTDTGRFRFSNANARAFDIAGKMVARGVNASEVSHLVYDQQPIGRLRLLSLVLDTLELSPRDKAASLVVSQAMLRQTHTTPEDAEGFVNHARSICGVEAGFLLREEVPGRYRVALRSKGRVDVSRIAAEFDGGGHRNAAGATVEGSVEEIRRRLYAMIEEALDEELLLRRQVG
ncbi:MAG: bifunctional oligoribonuclease/PAP phosphatase NrnA [Deltaproteobacteria bacterium]|nr:bifunctional oligoribonuclease/PAP phosphatase NrnA [Deltaproteobacteria bacterium]